MKPQLVILHYVNQDHNRLQTFNEVKLDLKNHNYMSRVKSSAMLVTGKELNFHLTFFITFDLFNAKK